MILSSSLESDFHPERRTIVFLHAFPLNSRMWKFQLDELQDSFNVLGLDFRGYGRSVSDETVQRGVFSFATFARDVHETLKERGISKAIIAGCSMGGYTMFEMWRQDPSVFEAMILCDTRAEPDTDEGREKRAEQGAWIRKRGEEYMARFVYENLISQHTRSNKPDLASFVKELVLDTSTITMIGTLDALGKREDSGPTLPTITVPTSIIVGENDGVTPKSLSERMEREIPGARMAVIPDAGHLAPLENATATNQAIREFLA